MIGAVDIGGTKIAVGMVDESGRLLARLESPTDPQRGPDYGLKLICEMFRQTASQAGGQLRGIGIGCTGLVNPLTGVLGTNEFLPGWEGMNLAEALSRSFGVSAAIENDADAAALSESAWGAGRGARSSPGSSTGKRFLYVTVSTGIGGGFVLDGKLYRGVDGAHPEIGHHVIDPSGPACFCGAHGCWESLASGPALARRGGRESAQEVCADAERGEPAALKAVEREGYYLGLGISNLVTLFIPDIIALGGGVMRSHHLFRDAIQATIRQNCGLVPYEKTVLVPAILGMDTGLIGAACVWLHRYGDSQ
jgi:glucokinase